MATTMADVSSKQMERERTSLVKAREIALSEKRMNVKVRLNLACSAGVFSGARALNNPSFASYGRHLG